MTEDERDAFYLSSRLLPLLSFAGQEKLMLVHDIPYSAGGLTAHFKAQAGDQNKSVAASLVHQACRKIIADTIGMKEDHRSSFFAGHHCTIEFARNMDAERLTLSRITIDFPNESVRPPCRIAGNESLEAARSIIFPTYYKTHAAYQTALHGRALALEFAKAIGSWPQVRDVALTFDQPLDIGVKLVRGRTSVMQSGSLYDLARLEIFNWNSARFTPGAMMGFIKRVDRELFSPSFKNMAEIMRLSHE